MIRSIRVTLTLWYVSILTAILCLFGWVLYTSVANNLAKDIDTILITEADSIADAIFLFWQEEPKDTSSRPHSPTLQKEIEEGRFQELISDWAKQSSELANMRSVRLIDLHNQVLESSKNFSELTPKDTQSSIEQAKMGQTVFETYVLPDYRVRIVTRPVAEQDKILYIVQVATLLRNSDASLRNLQVWILGLIPVTLLITSAGGWFLATTALKPVRLMIQQAQKIRAEELHKRIRVPRTKDELDQLAGTFNEMLSRLERAFKRLRQFSAAASHELRTPLTIMKGELEVALRKPRDKNEYERVLRTQLEALNEMVRIVEQLLTLAHSSGDGQIVSWHQTDLGQIAGSLCTTLRKIADLKNVRIVWDPKGPVWVRGEELLLQRLISNLIENAIKHTPAGGTVTVRTLGLKDEACLSVHNTGSSISPDELPKIFDKFFSSRPVPNDPASTGIGLGLCRWIAEVHGGRLRAESLPDTSVIFTVLLPLYRTPTLS